MKKLSACARKILNGYFRSLMEANPERWEKGRAAYICVNPGIRAHFQLIQKSLLYLTSVGAVDAMVDHPEKIVASLVSFIEPIRQFVSTASDKKVETNFSRKFGEGGVAEYFYNLCEIIQKKQKDFGSSKFKRYKERQADARIEQADIDIIDLQNSISQVVIETLKRVHGTHELPSGEKAYWDIEIDNHEIKQAAYKKQQMVAAAKRSPKEAYLDLIDFEKIVKQPGNWSHFEIDLQRSLAGREGQKILSCMAGETERESTHKRSQESISVVHRGGFGICKVDQRSAF